MLKGRKLIIIKNMAVVPYFYSFTGAMKGNSLFFTGFGNVWGPWVGTYDRFQCQIGMPNFST